MTIAKDPDVGNSRQPRGQRKERISIARLRDVQPNELSVLLALKDCGLTPGILKTLRFSGRPVSVHHLALISESKCVEYDNRPPPVDPTDKFSRKRSGFLNAAVLASIYTNLDPTWSEHASGSVDARYLLDTWGIYIATRTDHPGATVRDTVERLATEGIDIRLAWQIVRALSWNLICLKTCAECARPYIEVRASLEDSSWSRIPPGCVCCAELRELTRKRQLRLLRPKTRRRNTLAHENVSVTPIYATFSAQPEVSDAGTVGVCDQTPPNQRSSSSGSSRR